MRDEAAASLRRLNEVIELLRAPGGCPWDREQTHASLTPFLLEESYEVMEAIDQGGAQLKEELGDVLLQVLMHSAIAAERRGQSDAVNEGGGFDIGDVADAVTAKMIHRHPHVFGDAAGDTQVRAGDVVINWERLKAAEKPTRGSLLEGVPRSLPALAFAQAVQRRAARLGCETVARGDSVSGELDEPLQGLRDGLASHTQATTPETKPLAPGKEGDPKTDSWIATDGGFARGDGVVGGDPLHNADSDVESAIGELLFAVVGLARRYGVDAEDALRRRGRRAAEQFERVESRARAQGFDIHDLSPAQWRERWGAGGEA